MNYEIKVGSVLLEVFATFVEGLVSSLLVIPRLVSSLVLVIIVPRFVSSFVLIVVVVVPILVSTFVEVRFSSSLFKVWPSSLEIGLASLEVRLSSLLRFSKRFSLLLAKILFDLFFREVFYFFLI